jgi:hypothetical protein
MVAETMRADECAVGRLDDHPTVRRYTLRKDSRYIGYGFVLTLLWCKDERQLLNLKEVEGKFDNRARSYNQSFTLHID